MDDPERTFLILFHKSSRRTSLLSATTTPGKSTDDARYDEQSDGAVTHVEPGFYVKYFRKQSTNACYHGLEP